MAGSISILKRVPPLLALAGLVVLIGAAWYGAARVRDLAQARAARMAEVVTSHPLHVTHTPLMDLDGLSLDSEAAAAEAAAAKAAAVPASSQPQAVLPVEFFDFGAVGADAVVRREFLVLNEGSAALVIFGAYTTCGCTTADLTASVIPPGKASRVTVIFDAGFHPVSGQTVRRGLILETNDPNRPQVEIWVQAAVGR